MGFYSSSALVQGATRHDVEVLLVDVCVSGWECSLEAREHGRPAVCLELDVIDGTEHDAGLRIEEARFVEPFRHPRDFAARAYLNAGRFNVLADDVAAGLRRIGLTLGRYPLSFMRERLSAMKVIPSDVLHWFSKEQLARGGIVTVRQKPKTANGVVSITIEDEAGTVKVICW